MVFRIFNIFLVASREHLLLLFMEITTLDLAFVLAFAVASWRHA